jgi:hypothetical protein
MKRYRLKLSLPGKAGTILRLFPNALTFVAYLTPEQAEYQLAAMWFLQAYKIGLEVEEA